jgi:uncharacterized protein (TIGR03067 family)
VQLQLALTLAASFLTAPVPQDKTKDAQTIQGTWIIVSAETDGKPFNEIKGEKLILMKDGKAVTTTKTKEEKATYKINPTKKPKTIDFTSEKEPKPALGIYELAGDSLKLCLTKPGGERPTDFSSKGTDHLLIVLKRQKK